MESAQTQLRGIGIARQSHGDGESPKAQAERIRQACEREGIRLLRVITEQDVSGGTPLAKRAGLRSAVEDIEAGKAEVLIGAYFDRLFRSLKVQTEVLERVEGGNGRVLALDTGNVTNGSAGSWLSAGVLGMMAEYHRRATSERVRDSQIAAMKKGIPPWPHTTPGYQRFENGPLTPDPELRHVVNDAFKLRAQGKPIRVVREHLAAHGIRMSLSGVGDLLRSRVVLGELHFGDLEPNLAAHEAIVDRDVWAKVQRARASRGRYGKNPQLLARLGVLVCGDCGARMIAGTSGRAPRQLHPAYRCHGADCPTHPSITAATVDDAVKARARQIVADATGHASVDLQARRAKEAANAADKALKRATKLALLGDADDDPEVEAELTRLKAERNRLRAAADELEALSGQETFTADEMDDPLFTTDDWRRAIKATIARVIVGPGRGLERLTIQPRQQLAQGQVIE